MRRRIMLWSWDSLPEWAYSTVAKVCCLIVGHAPEADCSIPAHDFCIWCYKSMPGEAAR